MKYNKKITYIEKNGQKYAYQYNPYSSKTEYLGKIDPSTNELLTIKKPLPAYKTNKEIVSKSIGDVLILESVCRELGLLEDLTGLFGNRAKDILGLAMGLTRYPESLHINYILPNTSIPDVLDIALTENGFTTLDPVIPHIKIKEYSTIRSKRSGKGRIIQIKINSIKNTVVLIVLSQSGEPLDIISVPGNEKDTFYVIRLLNDLINEFGPYILMLDESFAYSGTYVQFINLKTEIIIRIDGKKFNTLTTEKCLNQNNNKKIKKIHGKQYMFYENDISVFGECVATSYKEYDPSNPPDYLIKIYSITDLEEQKKEKRRLEERITEIKKEIEGNNPDFIENLDRHRWSHSPYIKIKHQENKIKIEINSKEIQSRINETGLTHIISTIPNWNTTKAVLEKCNNNLLDSRSGTILNDDTFNGIPEPYHELNRLLWTLSASIRQKIGEKIYSSKYSLSIDEALQIASSLQMIEIYGDRYYTDIDEATIEVLNLFDIDYRKYCDLFDPVV